MDELAIKVDNVSKTFKLPHEKQSSVKSVFVNLFNPKKGFELQQALKDVSFEVKKGEFFGVVGRNGSGKSTLLKIIAGIYQASSGQVGTQGKLVPFIELGVGFNPELTGRENIYLNGALLGFSNREVKSMYKDIVQFAELERFMDQKLKNYSSGMQVRLAFSMAVRAKADVLIVDEVLAVGDADFQRKCFEYFKALKRNKKTVIFVSHDMGAVRTYCDRALLIDDGEIRAIGETADIASQYGRLFINEGATNDNFEKSTKGSRWGNGDVKISEASTSIVNNEVVIKAKAKARKPMENIMYGLHILAQDGSEIVALNNRFLNKPDLNIEKADSEIAFSWKVLNIFSDGRYFITLTLVDEAGIAFDWYVDASTFVVKKTERSATNVLPPIKVNYKVMK